MSKFVGDPGPLLRQLRGMGWRLWSWGEWTSGECHCVLYTMDDHPAAGALFDREKPRFAGRGGFSKSGRGPSLELALLDAASEILKGGKNDVDLDPMLQ